MLTPDYYDRLTDQLVRLYSELDEAIISDITRRLLKTGQVTDTAKWQVKQAQESGMLFEDVIAEIAKRTDATANHVRALFQDAGVKSVENDNIVYKEAGLSGIIKMSPAAMQTLEAGYKKCLGDLSNLTLTTANTAQEAYIAACNSAYMQVTSGAFDFNTAIRNAVKSAAEHGSEVLYPSGHRDKLDVAVRRSVLTGVGQTVRTLSEVNALDMGCDLMEITAHSGARPSHAEWQGQIVSLSGRKGYLSKADIGYGTGDGFGGWNCRHDWYPFFEGISKRAYSPERLAQLNARDIEYNGNLYTEYEISQIQRAMERDIRKSKRLIVAADTGRSNAENDAMRQAFEDEFAAQSVKLKAKEHKLNAFLKETGSLPDTARTGVLGFGRSEAQRAVWSDKKEKQIRQKVLQYLDVGDIINVDKIVSSYKKYIEKYPDSDIKYFMVDYRLRELGFKRIGIALPPKPKNAILVPDPTPNCNDPNHIFTRMKERNMSEDDLKSFMSNAKVMFSQWNGQRQTFRSEYGAVVLTKFQDDWIYKTVWTKMQFNKDELKILEVIRKYV